MNLKTGIWAAFAAPLLLAGAAQAAPLHDDGRWAAAGHVQQAGFWPRLFDDHSQPERPVVLAQAADPRITQLEEQVRELNGKIEELNFLILQMQDQVRKTQEDNEFRFQQIEGEKKTDAGQVAPSATDTAKADRVDPPASGQPAAPGELPKTLGTVTFDAKGNPTGGTADTEAKALPGAGTPPGAGEKPDDTVVAALPRTDNPDELYRNAYSFILSGDYPTAEAGFREHIDRFPNDPKASDAHYWLGEALLGMEEYRSAAEIFLAANRDFPKSRKAPDMLLKLGVSLAALNQRDVACATYSEIGKRYKDASAALKERVKAEQALAGC